MLLFGEKFKFLYFVHKSCRMSHFRVIFIHYEMEARKSVLGNNE